MESFETTGKVDFLLLYPIKFILFFGHCTYNISVLVSWVNYPIYNQQQPCLSPSYVSCEIAQVLTALIFVCPFKFNQYQSAQVIT